MADHYMVAAANPLAVTAGRDILAAGGSALDAAVAVQMVLNLVEPQSSGIGGGAFIVYYDARTGEVQSFDGRETAPASVTPDVFLDDSGEPLKFYDAVVGGRSVGVPGLVAVLHMAHRAHGRLPWAELFDRAILLAEDGFAVPPRLAAALHGPRGERLRTFAAARDYFFPGGRPLEQGQIVTNPAFADTLRRIAADGPAAFYNGEIAHDIVAAVRGTARNPGHLSPADMAGYRAIKRAPVCHPYRAYTVCGMGPPSSGALTVGQILGLLERFDMAALGPGDPQSWHLFAEAGKLAFADRARYAADSDFVPVPVRGLLDPGYLRERATAIRPDSVLAPPAAPGVPPGVTTPAADGTAQGRPGTSHISIIDVNGNALSMTTTIEGAFGSQIMVRGFLLNNELTDFSFRPARGGVPVANRVAPGKRPRSSMAPAIVLDASGKPRLVVGSPGGSRIISYVAQRLVAVLDWGMDIQSAIDMGHIANRNGATELEADTEMESLAPALTALGHEVRIRNLNSGLHGIEVLPDGRLRGGADPRRDGVAQGD